MICFVLVITEAAMEHKVYTTLIRTPEIAEVHPLFGEYDLILKIEVDTFEEMKRVITSKVRSIKGVIDVTTLTGVNI